MEQLTIHSKDYLVRWIHVPSGHSISWSLTPKSHSIQFGVFKHPGSSAVSSQNGAGTSTSPPVGSTSSNVGNTSSSNPNASAGSDTSSPTSPILLAAPDTTRSRRSSVQLHSAHGNTDQSVQDKLQKHGIKCVMWVGKCEADRVTTGRYDVPSNESSGMYGLVFDNTYSKTLSKHVTLVVMTYATEAPPKSGHHMHFVQAMARKSSGGSLKASGGRGGGSPALKAVGSPALRAIDDAAKSTTHKDFRLDDAAASTVITAATPALAGVGSFTTASAATNGDFFAGVLNKKRRKRNQGYARRFFSLDFSTATLSYYKNRNSPVLRGAIPLQLAAIGVNEKSRQISIDSGAEIWLLRAHSQRDFDGWRVALERSSQATSGVTSPIGSRPNARANPLETREWDRVEKLVNRITTINGAVKDMAGDVNPNSSGGTGLGLSSTTGPTSPVTSEAVVGDYFGAAGEIPERPNKTSFWRRKSSSGAASPRPSAGFAPGARSPSANRLAVPTTSSIAGDTLAVSKRPGSASSTGAQQTSLDENLHKRCLAIINQLDSVISDFSSLIAESKYRRNPPAPPENRLSMESTLSQEFFDAPDGGAINEAGSTLLRIKDDGDSQEAVDADAVSQYSTDSSVDAGANGTAGHFDGARTSLDGTQTLGVFPTKPRSFHPLSLKSAAPRDVQRRTNIPASTAQPPSLIGFLRKNVGKDLSTIAMPVTANEPLSLLQRQAEALENSHLLDQAAATKDDAVLRLLYVAAFAVSALANTRDKSRAIRKPFNPMLGETFELVREDKGYRFVAEKVSHRPVRVASQADSVRGWQFAQSPAPDQKFWGKSAELITDGRVRVVLNDVVAGGEFYTWNPPTCFLRNLIAGEKYVEPVGDFSIVCETSGLRAVASFKAGGMFSGRSEEVNVSVANGSSGEGLAGKWTSHLDLVSNQKRIWEVLPLVDQPATHYGMTRFATTLNEVTELDKGAIPPTDSRLRPDQRAYEEGDVDKAETLKARLEENQRRRRKEMETAGEVWSPRWFEKVDAAVGEGSKEEVWAMKLGEANGGYWEVRDAVVNFKGGKWDGVRSVFET